MPGQIGGRRHGLLRPGVGLISQATGTFQDVSSGITERGYPGGTGSLTSNAFSLQLNSQFFAGSPACSGAGDPSGCQAWQQFVYTYVTPKISLIFMQYWLIGYDATCPSGWSPHSDDCWTNSSAAQVSTLTASQLAGLRLTASAQSGGNDDVSLAVESGAATSVSSSDSKVNLASHWNTTEWGVFGDGNYSEAYFGSGTTLEAQTALTATNSAAPYCILGGFTGETNNLTPTSTPALGSESSPTMASTQTYGTTGTASCAAAAQTRNDILFYAAVRGTWATAYHAANGVAVAQKTGSGLATSWTRISTFGNGYVLFYAQATGEYATAHRAFDGSIVTDDMGMASPPTGRVSRRWTPAI